MALTRVTTGGIAPGVEIKFNSANAPTAPAISFDGDTDTGIYNPDPDTFAISTAGVERFKIGPNGEITIGTPTDPTYLPITDSSAAGHTAKTLYVNANDSKSDDALDNNGENLGRPYKTIERALIEAARRSYVPGIGQSAGEAGADQFEYFTIVVYPGQYTIDNRPGVFAGAAPEWSGDYSALITENTLNTSDFYKFNAADGGVIVPRGTSIVGMDLRKTVIRPLYVPDPAGSGSEAAIFRLTGGCYIWQLTIKDATGQPYATQSSQHPNAAFSHHRLVGFKFATAADLNAYYRKIDRLDGNIPASGNSIYELYKRTEENRIVGEFTNANNVDTVASASPYVFNCSLRSVWGMSGQHADGSDATGFKSMVVAQFTGISLQKDANAFINGQPTSVFDNYKDGWRHYHIKASNGSFIQIVSVFAVGYADHFVAEAGGDMSITNSNSNFGHTSLKSIGSSNIAYPQNSNGQITALIPPRGIDPNTRTETITLDFPNVERTLFAEANSNPVSYASAQSISTNLENTFKIIYIGQQVDEDDIPELRLTEGGVDKRYLAFGTTNSYLLTKKGGETVQFTIGGNTYTDTLRTANSSNDPSYNDTNNGERVGYGFDIMGTYSSGPKTGKKYGFLYLKVNTAPTAGSSTVVTGTALATDGTFTISAANNFANGDEVLFTAGTTFPTPQDNQGQLNGTTPYYVVGKSGNNFKLARTIGGVALDFANGSTQTFTFTRRATPVTTGILGILHKRVEVSAKLAYEFYFTAGTTNLGLDRVADVRTSVANSELLWRVEYTLPQNLNCKPPEKNFVIRPNAGSVNDVFYILTVEKGQDYIFGQQDGIYYLTCLLGSIRETTETTATPGAIYLYEGTNIIPQGVAQNINYLYPVIDEDEPEWNPLTATSKVQILDLTSNNNTYKKNLFISAPTGNDLQFTSITREACDKLITQFGLQKSGTSTAASTATPYGTSDDTNGKDVATKDRRLAVNPVQVKLHRPSIIRASAHTWEYLGYGGGNYSTSLPQFHQVVLSREEQFVSQTLSLAGGVNASTGTNSAGEFYIGNNIQDASGFDSVTLNVPSVKTSSQTRLIDYSNTFNSISNSIAQVNQSLSDNVSNLQLAFQTQIQGLANSFTTTSLTVEDTASISTLNISTKLSIAGVTDNLGLAAEDKAGIVRLATQAEATLGTADDIAISPKSLTTKTASSIKGLVNVRMSLSAPAAGTSYLYPLANIASQTYWYLHPYRGNEISLYDHYQGIWSIVQIGSSLQFYLTNDGTASGTALAANTVYDVYVYNASSDPTSPDVKVEYTAWANDHTPPTRGNVQGILTKSGGTTNDNKRYIGVVRTTSAGTIRQNLGGVIATSVTDSTTPYIGIANFYNIYKATQRYFFGSGWYVKSSANNWNLPPVYLSNAVINVVTADDSALTAFVDLYSNGDGIVYCVPGFDQTDAGAGAFTTTALAATAPFDTSDGQGGTYTWPGSNPVVPYIPVDAFYGEQEGSNQTATSCWSRTLGAGFHRVFYLNKLFDAGSNHLNEHAAHGWIVTAEV